MGSALDISVPNKTKDLQILTCQIHRFQRKAKTSAEALIDVSPSHEVGRHLCGLGHPDLVLRKDFNRSIGETKPFVVLRGLIPPLYNKGQSVQNLAMLGVHQLKVHRGRVHHIQTAHGQHVCGVPQDVPFPGTAG